MQTLTTVLKHLLPRRCLEKKARQRNQANEAKEAGLLDKVEPFDFLSHDYLHLESFFHHLCSIKVTIGHCTPSSEQDRFPAAHQRRRFTHQIHSEGRHCHPAWGRTGATTVSWSRLFHSAFNCLDHGTNIHYASNIGSGRPPFLEQLQTIGYSTMRCWSTTRLLHAESRRSAPTELAAISSLAKHATVNSSFFQQSPPRSAGIIVSGQIQQAFRTSL